MGSKRRGKRGGRGSGEGEGQEVRRLDGRVGRARPLTLIRNCGVLRTDTVRDSGGGQDDPDKQLSRHRLGLCRLIGRH